MSLNFSAHKKQNTTQGQQKHFFDFFVLFVVTYFY